MPMSSMRKPTIKHRYPKKSKIRISISRLICHSLPALNFRKKAADRSASPALISSPEKIPDKTSLHSAHCDTLGGNSLAKRKQRIHELPRRPRSDTLLSELRLTTGAEYKCPGPKTSRFLFFSVSLSSTPPGAVGASQRECRGRFANESENLMNHPADFISSEIRFSKKDAASLIATNCVSPVLRDLISILFSLRPLGPMTAL